MARKCGPEAGGKALTEWELWACANQYIRQHGEDAAILAAMRADEKVEACDLDGARTWRAIVKRINELLATPTGALQ